MLSTLVLLLLSLLLAVVLCSQTRCVIGDNRYTAVAATITTTSKGTGSTSYSSTSTCTLYCDDRTAELVQCVSYCK
jgi:hypothetical protein